MAMPWWLPASCAAATLENPRAKRWAPQDVRYLGVCMRIPNSKHTWASVCCSRVCIHVGLRDHFGFGLSSFKATPVQLSVWQTCNMARSASRVLACVLLALACSAMLCFVGTTPSPAAGSTPLKQSLRAPSVQMEARGGGEGALGDMSPDTYIIGITVLGIASLFANISGFFNPWEDRSREWQRPWYVGFLVPLQCLHRFDLLSLTEQRIVRIGAEIASLREQMGTGMGMFSMLTCPSCSGSRVQCMFVWTAADSAKGILYLGSKRHYLLGLITCEHHRMWDTWMFAWEFPVQNIHECQCVALGFVFTSDSVIILASAWALLRPLLCSSLCGKTCNMARSASRVLACVLLALACSAMLCFVGTTPSPAAGSTPLKQSLRAPSVQMEARGGGEGALGDMSPDTYIIGITVLGIASLFANISGFFNPWEDRSRELQRPWYVGFLVPLQCLHRFDLLSLTEQRIVRIGAEIASLREQMGTGMGMFSMLTCPSCSVSRVQCMFVWTAADSAKGILYLGSKRHYLLGLITCEHHRMWDTWMFAWEFPVQNIHERQCVALGFVFTSDSVIILASAWALLRPLLCSSLCGKLATWLAPPHVCLLACSWPLPARQCFALWAPLQVLLQEALRWSSLCGHRPCRWRRGAVVRVPLATWVPTPTSLASPCLGSHPCLPTSAASSTHEKTGVESGSGHDM